MGSHNLHGYIINTNTTASLLDLSGNFTFVPTELSEESHIIKGERVRCHSSRQL